MAREASDREDLLREAVGLPDRIEFQPHAYAVPVVIGFRANGAVSLFVGQDETYQFTSDGQLRRAYWHGELLKAERRALVGLLRMRGPQETALLRRELDERQTEELLKRLRQRTEQLVTAIRENRISIHGVVASSHEDVLRRAQKWLEGLADPVPIADRPHVC